MYITLGDDDADELHVDRGDALTVPATLQLHQRTGSGSDAPPPRAHHHHHHAPPSSARLLLLLWPAGWLVESPQPMGSTPSARHGLLLLLLQLSHSHATRTVRCSAASMLQVRSRASSPPLKCHGGTRAQGEPPPHPLPAVGACTYRVQGRATRCATGRAGVRRRGRQRALWPPHMCSQARVPPRSLRVAPPPPMPPPFLLDGGGSRRLGHRHRPPPQMPHSASACSWARCVRTMRAPCGGIFAMSAGRGRGC